MSGFYLPEKDGQVKGRRKNRVITGEKRFHMKWSGTTSISPGITSLKTFLPRNALARPTLLAAIALQAIWLRDVMGRIAIAIMGGDPPDVTISMI